MSGGWPVPDPWAPGPKQPRLMSQPGSSPALLGSLPDPPDCLASPRPPPGGPAELEPPGDKAGCRGGGHGVTERRGASSPSVRKAATCSSPMEPFFSRPQSLPSPAAAGGPSGWPPSTFLTPGETPPHPSSAPQDPQGPATVPGSQAGQWPSHSPWTSPQGVVASTPQRLHSQFNPSDRDRKKKNKKNAG